MSQPNQFTPLAKRFWARVEKTAGCWLWTGKTTTTDGYGTLHVDGKERRAHRVALELAGQTIPPGMHACHRCDNPACVNPAHLFVGSNRDNMRDASRKGRLPGQKQTHCKRGHEFTPENTRITVSGNRACRACMRASQAARAFLAASPQERGR